LWLPTSRKKWYCRNYIRAFLKQGGSIPEQNVCLGSILIFVILLWFEEVQSLDDYMMFMNRWPSFFMTGKRKEIPRIWAKLAEIWNHIIFEILFVWRV
jgi:hypothetical protein